MTTRTPRQTSGAALVVAMLLTALGAAVAVQMIVPLSGWLEREYRARDTQASYTLADAAASWALTVLAADARLGPVDHYGELWATPLPATPVEGGSIEGRITDLQAGFNLNNVAPRGVRSAPNIALARSLFTQAGVPSGLVDALADSIDRDEVTEDGQSERQRYGRNLRNAPLRRFADLLEVPGFTEAQYESLALAYIAASMRAGDWLIPGFHAAIDEGLSDGHDDPQNFELSRFDAALAGLLQQKLDRKQYIGLVGDDQYLLHNPSPTHLQEVPTSRRYPC